MALDGYNTKFANNNDEEEEKFVDVKTESSGDEGADNNDDDDDNVNKKKKKGIKREINGKSKKQNTQQTSWIHKNNIIHKTHDSYDYTQRNPLYSGADKTLTYELILYSRHYHPTVAIFANNLINVKKLNFNSFKIIKYLKFLFFFHLKRAKLLIIMVIQWKISL